MPYKKVKIKYFDYVRFQYVTFLTCNIYISRGKASNIDNDSSNIEELINNDDTTGDDNNQSQSEEQPSNNNKSLQINK